jgi:MYXO-CTERM domain-containing protein
LIEGSDTYLYGVAAAGGPEGTGTIFRVSRDGTDFDRLYAFSADTDTTNSGLIVTVDGAAPVGPLVQVGTFLYGTTSVGGSFGRGVIFRIGLDGTGFKVLKNFPATTNDTTTGLPENAEGAIPLAGLTDGNDGFLYGVTSVGGTNGQGVIFSLDLALVGTGVQADLDAAYNVIHEFGGNGGTRPVGELLLGADGKLYGTTSAGGETTGGQPSTLGTFFSIDRTGQNFTRLHSFTNDVGAQPSSRPLQLGAGLFVGTVQLGGKCGYGAIWRYSAAGDTVTGNTRCGQGSGNNNNDGGGSFGWATLALLGALGALRRRRG